MHSNQIIHFLKPTSLYNFYQQSTRHIVLVLSSYAEKIRHLILFEEE